MTREEAYNRIDAIIAKYEIDEEYVTITSALDYDALRMARKALEQQSCGDIISRQTVLDIADSYSESQSNVEDVTQDIISDIVALPPVNPQPKTGWWIYGEDNLGTGRDGWYCNQCGHFEFWDYNSDMKSAKLNLPNYCPNCGCRMVEPQERSE